MLLPQGTLEREKKSINSPNSQKSQRNLRAENAIIL